MQKFKDKHGRIIEIIIDDTNVLATYKGKQIGEFLYREIEFGCKNDYDSYFELFSMNAEEEFQKSGIGLKMIEVGENSFEKVVYPKEGTDNYPTLEGAALLNAAINKGSIRSMNDEEYTEEIDDDFFI